MYRHIPITYARALVLQFSGETMRASSLTIVISLYISPSLENGEGIYIKKRRTNVLESECRAQGRGEIRRKRQCASFFFSHRDAWLRNERYYTEIFGIIYIYGGHATLAVYILMRFSIMMGADPDPLYNSSRDCVVASQFSFCGAYRMRGKSGGRGKIDFFREHNALLMPRGCIYLYKR